MLLEVLDIIAEDKGTCCDRCISVVPLQVEEGRCM